MGLNLVYSSAAEPEPVCMKTYPYTAGRSYENPNDPSEVLSMRMKYMGAIRELGLQEGDFKISQGNLALIVHVKESALVYKLNSLADRIEVPIRQNPNIRPRRPGAYEPPLKDYF